jgi:hypothetical protein
MQSTIVEGLVTGVEPIRHCLKAIAGSIPKDLERVIKPTTFFEFRQFDVVEALQRMDDHTVQDDLKARTTKADDQNQVEQEKLSKAQAEIDELQSRIEKEERSCQFGDRLGRQVKKHWGSGSCPQVS